VLGATSIATDATRPVTFTWPGADGIASAALNFIAGGPAGKDQQGNQGGAAAGEGVQATGAWALFRLLGEARLQPEGSPDSYLLTFTTGGAQAAFTLQAGSSHNPFGHNALAGFKCPEVR
jgi:type VI secretion system protein ImpL